MEYLATLKLDCIGQLLCRKYLIRNIQLRKWRGGHVAFVNSPEASRIYSLGYHLIKKRKPNLPSATALSWIRYNPEGLKETITAPRPTPKHTGFKARLRSKGRTIWIGGPLYLVQSQLQQSKVKVEVEVDEDVEIKDTDTV